jgi:hypothetical protein
MALTKRSVKGTSLTYAEMDANFTHLGGDGSYVFPATDGTANHVLATDGNGQLSFVAQTGGGGGGIALTDLSIGTEASASGDGGIGYDNTTGVFTYTPPDLSSYLTTVAFSDLTGKPTTISGYGITDAFDGAFASLSGKPTTIAGYGITDAFDGATSSLTGNIDLATQVTGTLPVGNMAATALTTVQTASSESAHLALTAQEGDVVVRTDENKTYMHNGGSAGTMADYTLLATPTDAVTSVDGNTGAVTTLQLGTSSTTALAGDTTFSFADITSKPTTISGYGITDNIVTSDSSIDAQPVKQLYSNQAAFPSASTWHGALAHSHSDGAMFFAHAGSWVQLANDSDIPTAVSSLTNDSNYLTTVAFADLTGKPTTIAGYGITDALQLGTTSTTALAGDTTFAFADITSKPTTIAGYGITDALQLGTSSTTALAGDTTFAFADITSKPTTISGYGITDALQLGTSSTTALAGDTTFAFADITSKPTTIAGYGITDALELSDFSATQNNLPSSSGSVTYSGGVITYQPQYNLYPPTQSTAQDIGLLQQTADINLGISTNSHTVNIAGGSTTGGNTNTVNIASTGSTGSTQTVNIARMTATGVTTNILMGNTSSSATSNITLTGNTTINNALSSNTITIGGTTQTGAITLGASTQTQTIDISNAATANTKTNTINLGCSGIGGSTTNVNIAANNGTVGATTNVAIGNNTSTATSTIALRGATTFSVGAVEFNGFNFTVNPSGPANTITMGRTDATGTITIGRSTDTHTINISAASLASTKSKTINIGTGFGIRTVNIASDSQSGATTTVYLGNPSATASSTVLLQGNVSVDRPLYGDGATEYYDFFDHEGGHLTSSSDGDYDISGTGLNALTEITIPARASFTGSKRGSLRMSCQVAIYNSSSSTKRTAEYYMGLQMKSKGTSAQSENLGVGTFVSSPSAYNGVWSFAGNVTDKIVAGFGQLGKNSSASGMTYGGAQILKVWYDCSVNKTYIRVSSYYYYNNLGGSAVSAGNSTSFDVYYNPTDFQASGTWVSSLRADFYSSRVRYTIQPTSTHSMNHAFNLSVPKETSKTELRLIFDYQSSNTNLSAAVYAIEGTVMLEGSRV